MGLALLARLALCVAASEAARPRFVQSESPSAAGSEPGQVRRTTSVEVASEARLRSVDPVGQSELFVRGGQEAPAAPGGRSVARESFIETTATLGARTGTPWLFLSLAPSAMSTVCRVTGLIAICAALRWLCKKTEKTCCVPSVDIKVRVHTVSNVAKKDYFIAFVPCERGRGKKKPILDKKSEELRCTKTSSDLRWESDVTVSVPQGFPELNVCLFQPSSIPGRRPACVAWATLRVEKLLNDGPTTYKECKLEMENKTDYANVVLDFGFESDSDKPLPKKTLAAGLGEPRLSSSGWSLRPNKLRVSRSSASGASMADSFMSGNESEGDPEEKAAGHRTELMGIGQRLEGDLEITDKYGEYVVKSFKVRCKRDTWSWEWYAAGAGPPPEGRRPVENRRTVAEGAGFEGRIPFRSIVGISAVPQSVSEFAIKYINKDKRQCTMVLKRTNQSRDDLVADLHKMLQTIKRFRRVRGQIPGGRVTRTTGDRSTGRGSDEE